MNAPVVTFLLMSAVAVAMVPRRWAPLPFITAACYLNISHVVEVGPFSFTVIRILIAVGVVRVLCRGERFVGAVNGIDWWIIPWCVWTCVSGLFREDAGSALVFRMGLVYDTAGIYLLLRVFCTSIDDVVRLCQALAILLFPVGLEMLYETRGSLSLFYVMEGTPLEPFIREGRTRALGPFLSPITAGTVGAVSIPLMVGIWRRRRKTACAGLLGCVFMVCGSASSGPILSAAASIGALLLWRCRSVMRPIRWLIVIGYIGLSLVMKAPVYYLMGRIDLAGGSTGWHRARVIDSAITYIDEWWLAGTEYTRHWAPSPGWSPNHTDITSQYLYVGVLGGLPLMLLFIGGVAKAFSLVGRGLREHTSRQDRFMLWTSGAALFAHAATFMSVSYFDQSFVFFYLTLAAIGAARPRTAEVVSVPERVTYVRAGKPCGLRSSNHGTRHMRWSNRHNSGRAPVRASRHRVHR
jgi:hypothetical protein